MTRSRLKNDFSIGIDDDATSTAITIDASENVGIGTTSPADELHVNSTSANINMRLTRDTNTGARISGSDGASTPVIKFDTIASGTATERMRIASDGDVGIGVTSPSARLDVREEKTGGALLVQVYNTDNSDTTTQTAGLALGPDSRGATAKITAVKENASFATNAGRDVALTFSSVLNNSPTEYMRIDSAGQIIILGSGGSTVNSLDLSYNGTSGQATIQADSSGGSTFLTFGTSDSGTVAERMRITSAGNVGIGTTAPSQELHVKGSVTVANFEGTGGSGFIQITDSDDGTSAFVGVDAGKLKFQTSGSSYSDKVVIDTAGKMGIGTSAPQSLLQLNTTPPTAFGSPFLSVGFNTYTASGMYTIAFGYEALSGSIAPAEIGLVTTSDSSFTKGDLVFATRDVVTNTAPTERMRMDSAGNLLIGTTSNPFSSGSGSGFLSTSYGRRQLRFAHTDNGGTARSVVVFYGGTAGNQVGSINASNSATVYNTSSDVRLKENIVDAPAGNIDAIRVRSFDWKTNGTHQPYGLIAQELVDVAPEAVTQGETDDEMWQVDYSKLVPMMVKEIQDLRVRVAQLEGN